MNIAFGVTWGDSREGRLPALLAAFVALMMLALPWQESPPSSPSVRVIVSGTEGAAQLVEAAVTRAGGTIDRRIDLIDGVSASVPAGALDQIEEATGVRAVTPDSKVRFYGLGAGLDDILDFNPASDPGAMFNITSDLGARALWKQGHTGDGVDVALIDTGVVPVSGLDDPDKIVNGPDLSFESQSDDLSYLDTNGHGTHMAGIIAGSDPVDTLKPGHPNEFHGVAPEARIVSVKVGDASGAADVSQVIAAINWVIEHKNDNGLDIRVLNLSFGTDGTQDYLLDPLTYAVETAWHKGIVVVVAAGNQGFGNSKLNNPAYDPFVIAVGADDTKGTPTVLDDTVPDWSSRGDGVRNPDVVAPGKSLVSLRNPASDIDLEHPGGRVGERFFKGSGTSQAAAVVTGAAALLIDHRPELTPDQVKHVLMDSASFLPVADLQAQGEGLIDIKRAANTPAPQVTQPWPRATGTGSLELARGSAHLEDSTGNVLTGEQDIFGEAWDAEEWARNTWSGTTWSGGTWNRNTWSGSDWSGSSWTRNTWSRNTWSRNTWSGENWSRNTWSRNTWSRNTWSGESWLRNTWSGVTWSRNTWSRNTWSRNTWSGSDWN